MRNHIVAFIAIALVAGCGGGEGSSVKSTTPDPDVARTAGGEAITTADGSAVSKKAHGKWESALEEFEANEKAGWTSAKCSSSSKAFERVSDAQGAPGPQSADGQPEVPATDSGADGDDHARLVVAGQRAHVLVHREHVIVNKIN